MTELERLLTDARQVPVTDAEHVLFAMNPSRALFSISQRIGRPLTFDQALAYATSLRCLFIIE